MVFEGIPNGPMDCWQDVKTPEQHLQCSLDLLKKFVPWEYERCANVELTDAGFWQGVSRRPYANPF